MYQKKGLYIEYARLVKEAVSVPVICAGRMDNPDMASEAVRSGACDIVSPSAGPCSPTPTTSTSCAPAGSGA